MQVKNEERCRGVVGRSMRKKENDASRGGIFGRQDEKGKLLCCLIAVTHAG